MIDFNTEDMSHPAVIVGLVVVCSLLWRLVSFLFEKITHHKDRADELIKESLRNIEKKLDATNSKLSELHADFIVVATKVDKLDDKVNNIQIEVRTMDDILNDLCRDVAVHTEKIKNLENRK